MSIELEEMSLIESYCYLRGCTDLSRWLVFKIVVINGVRFCREVMK